MRSDFRYDLIARARMRSEQSNPAEKGSGRNLQGQRPEPDQSGKRDDDQQTSHGHFGVKFMITASWVSPLVAVRDPRSKPVA